MRGFGLGIRSDITLHIIVYQNLTNLSIVNRKKPNRFNGVELCEEAVGWVASANAKREVDFYFKVIRYRLSLRRIIGG